MAKRVQSIDLQAVSLLLFLIVVFFPIQCFALEDLVPQNATCTSSISSCGRSLRNATFDEELHRLYEEETEIKNVTKVQILMSTAEQLLLRAVYRRANHVLEYGLGGSTLIANSIGVPMVTGVDSFKKWVNDVSKAVSPRYNILFADTGPVGGFANPVKSSPNDVKKWPAYWGIGIREAMKHSIPEVVLVDGRFRRACASAVALAWGRHVLIGVHDVHRYREDLLEVLEEVIRRDSLSFFRLKRGVAQHDVLLFLQKYMMKVQ